MFKHKTIKIYHQCFLLLISTSPYGYVKMVDACCVSNALSKQPKLRANAEMEFMLEQHLF